MSELIFETQPEQIAAGQFPDLGLELPPLVADAENVSYEAGVAAPVPSQVQLFPRVQTSRILGMNSQLVNLRDTLIFGTQDKLWGWDAVQGKYDLSNPSTTYDITGVAVEPEHAHFWTIVSWGEWTLASSCHGKIQIRKPAAPFYDTKFEDITEDAEAPEDVHILIRRSPFIMALHSDKGNAAYNWSDRDNVEQWVPAANNFAGGNILRDTDSDIMAAVPFRGEIAVFTENTMHMIYYTGDSFVFADRQLLKGIGASGHNAVCVAGNKIFGIGKRGIWKTDGGSYDYIATPAIAEFFLSTLEKNQISQCVAWHDQDNERVVFYYPHIDQEEKPLRNNFGLVHNYRYNSWGVITIGRTCADRSNVVGMSLTGDYYGTVYAQTLNVLPSNQLGEPKVEMLETWSVKIGYGEGGFGNAGYGGAVGETANGPTTSPSEQLVVKYTDGITGRIVFYPSIVPNQAGSLWLLTKDLDLGYDKDKYCDGIVIKIKHTQVLQGLSIQYAIKDRLSDPDVWSDEVSLASGDTVIRPESNGRPGVTFRYIKLRIRDVFVLERWKITSIQFWGQIMEGRVHFEVGT